MTTENKKEQKSITGELLGVIVLKLTGSDKNFVCTSASIDMEVNNIPSAIVTIGTGVGIKTPANTQRPEELLATILAKRDSGTSAYTGMAECQLVEVVSGQADKTVFSGVIVAGNIVYKTGTPTVKMIRLQCMNKAISLYGNPVSQFSSVTGQYIINYMQSYGNFDGKNNFGTASTVDKLPIAKQVENLKHSDATTIINRVADAVDAVVYAKDYATQKSAAGSRGYKQKILDCFCGDATLNTEPILYDKNGGLLSNKFDEWLIRLFSSRLENESVYNAMQSILLSDNFMLSFIPRWSAKSFKMEIAPSRAWDPDTKKIIKIPIDRVSSFDTSYNPMAVLQTPSVFLVNFSDAVSTFFNSKSCKAVGRPGVFSVNEKAMEHWKNVFDNNEFADDSDITQTFNAKLYNAPAWTTPLVVTEGAMSAQNRDNLNKMRTSKKPGEQTDIQKANQATKAADMIAKALYTYIFGSEDKCSIELMPSARFGRDTKIGAALEDRLGDTVDIEFTDDMEKTSNIRGMLNKISYYYTCGASGCHVSYTIQLSRVRMLNTDETPIPCPLYKY